MTIHSELQMQTMHMLQQTTQQGLQTLSQQITSTLEQHNQSSMEKIQNLTQTTRQRLQDIVGAESCARRHVFSRSDQADDTPFELGCGDCLHGAQDRGSSGHIGLHRADPLDAF